MKLVTYMNVKRDATKEALCKEATGYIVGLKQQFSVAQVLREMVLFSHKNRKEFEKFSGMKLRES